MTSLREASEVVVGPQFVTAIVARRQCAPRDLLVASARRGTAQFPADGPDKKRLQRLAPLGGTRLGGAKQIGWQLDCGAHKSILAYSEVSPDALSVDVGSAIDTATFVSREVVKDEEAPSVYAVGSRAT